jgi:uncharacterized protein YndB with AHSA1/START domain
MNETPPPPPAPPRRRRLLIAPLVLLGLLLAFLLWAFVRGTWSTTEIENPAAPEDGARSQLILRPDAHKHIRCARVVAAPPEKVWATVTAYDRFDRIFPYVSSVDSSLNRDGSTRLIGTVDAGWLGRYSFEAAVRHDVQPSRHVASWDQPGGGLDVNRGRWEVTPLPGGRALLVYELEVEVRQIPTFLVRALLLGPLRRVVEAAARDAEAP